MTRKEALNVTKGTIIGFISSYNDERKRDLRARVIGINKDWTSNTVYIDVEYLDDFVYMDTREPIVKGTVGTVRHKRWKILQEPKRVKVCKVKAH